MRLFLRPGAERVPEVLVARFDGASVGEAEVPVDTAPLAEAAHDRLRNRYAALVHDFARATGLLEIAGWEGALAAYWLVPFSERSPMRSRLIESLYHLVLLDLAIAKHRPRAVSVTTDDDGLWQAISRLAAVRGVAASREGGGSGPAPSPWDRLRARAARARRLAGGLARIVRARAALAAEAWAKWRLLRDQAEEVMATCAGRPGRLVAFYTRYPVLWEMGEGKPARERNFGTFPDFLADRDFDVVYPAAFSASAATLRSTASTIRGEARERRVVFLDGLVSPGELMRSAAAVGPTLRYLLWRAGLGRRPVLLDGVDVRELVLRELDADFLYGAELTTNHMRAYGMRRFGATWRPRVVFHPFEYQPMERSICAGVTAGSAETAVVGVQTGIYAVNRPAWWWGPGEVGMPPSFPSGARAPFPHYLATYGRRALEAFSRHCPPERLLSSAAIRYSHVLAASPEAGAERRGAASVLVAGTVIPEETRHLLLAAVAVARARPDVVLLLKFHYHNPMHAEWERMSDGLGTRRSRVFDTNLVELLERSRAVLLGWSSTSIIAEAIALGCMPVVLQPASRFGFGCAFDAREAVFVCEDEGAMVGAVLECLADSAGFRRRRSAWPRTLEELLGRRGESPNERLYSQLAERGVLPC